MANAHLDAQDPTLSDQPDAQDSSQVSIKKMFWWVTLCAFAAGSFAKFPELFRNEWDFPSGQTIGIVTVSWFVFLFWHWRQKNVSALLIHTITVALMYLFIWMLGNRVTESTSVVPIMLATLLCAQAMSIILGLTATTSKVINRHGKPASFLFYCVTGSTLVVAAICGIIPSLMKGFPDFQAIAMGAMIGCWMGLYQATAKSKWIQEKRFLGAKPRHIVLAGFLFSFFSPIFFSIANETFLRTTYYYLPVWLTPGFGFIAAAIVIAASRFFRSSRTQH
jgi:hypothetical protein